MIYNTTSATSIIPILIVFMIIMLNAAKLKKKMEDKPTNGQNINKERYCPNVFFDNGSMSIGEFKTLDEAMNFPIQEIWSINRTEDNKYNSYRNQGTRVLIICEWSKSIQDSRKFVVALVLNDGTIKYFDLNDLSIDAKLYEENLNNEALYALKK